MIILGIGDSHESHACVVQDGEITALVAEERLSRVKADTGYPIRAIDSALRQANIEPRDIDVVAFAGRHGSPLIQLTKEFARFSVKDWVRLNHEYWRPVLFEGKQLTPIDRFDLFRDVVQSTVETDPYYPFVERARAADPCQYPGIFDALRKDVIADHLGLAADRVRSYRHETCHQAYGFFSSPYDLQGGALIFTCEGGGDDSSATVAVANATLFDEEWRSNDVQIGRLYAYTTLLLGMKPGQHEYKVMGLAPYGSSYHGRRALEYFRTINQVKGREIVKVQTVPDLYFSTRDALEGVRFDGIAWALQAYTEEILTQWVENNCASKGIRNVVLSGGVAQNIKAAKAISELGVVDKVWTPPVAGDGSIGVGAAWLASHELDAKHPIRGLTTIYLGTNHDEHTIDRSISANNLAADFDLIEKPLTPQVANWIADGKILARFSGRMEFGQRALGNRSILADPRKPDTVERINSKIKYRDFWMPFTPSMLMEDAEQLLENPKRLYSPFMTMAFDLKPGVAARIPAVVHPADKTVRPQILAEEDNPAYHALLTAFKRLTGLGVLLNTSFNLHGEPIVESADDAISTFLRSDLDGLVFDHVAIMRRT